MIFETLLTYDYLARPAKLVPLTAEALPQITDNGQTYTFRLRKGIYFTPDPAFKGAKRELVADDYVYLAEAADGSEDPLAVDVARRRQDRRPRRAGGEGEGDAAASTTPRRSPGLEAVDRYTLRIRLKQPDYNLSYVLAHEPTSAVAREVVAAYADAGGRMMSNPVGTGPYKLATWVRSSKIVLEANPDYRGFVWDFKAGTDPGDAALVAEMKGKKMPQVGRIEISIMEEDQSRLLAFQNGELDLMNMEGPLAPKVLDGGEAHAGHAEEGREAVPLRRPRDLVSLLEPAGSGRRRPREGEDRAAPRDGDGLSRRRGDQGRAQRPGGRGAVPDSARRRRPRSRPTSRA